MLYNSVTETIGNTPIIRLHHIEKEFSLPVKLYAKVEFFNPGSSVKDRIALAMIEDAEKKGVLKPGATIIEPTSGNTGIGLAMVGAAKGYHVILTMPDTLSIERRQMVQAYGAKLVLTEGAKGMKGAIAKAEEILAITPNSFMPYQFKNLSNPKKHYETTGPEIWDDLHGDIDFFVAGVGTGGTISGTGKYLKEQNAQIQIIAIEPEASPVLSGGNPGPHQIQGIGAGFVPDTLDTGIYNEIIRIQNEEAIQSSRILAKREGIFAGISAGAAMAGAIQIGKRPENKGKSIVFVVPDTGERYLSTNLVEQGQ
ncbi:MAG: cysteine synthase A [Candidatus Izemoplasmatales bacterium]